MCPSFPVAAFGQQGVCGALGRPSLGSRNPWRRAGHGDGVAPKRERPLPRARRYARGTGFFVCFFEPCVGIRGYHNRVRIRHACILEGTWFVVSHAPSFLQSRWPLLWRGEPCAARTRARVVSSYYAQLLQGLLTAGRAWPYRVLIHFVK